MTNKRRALVLVDESARHPFRQSLPPYIRAQAVAAPRKVSWIPGNPGDWKVFFAAYCAAFVVVSIFIA